MSLLSRLFPRQSVQIATNGFLNLITGYQPVFTSFDGGVYEAALCRSAIHTFASQCSKLDIQSPGPNERYRKLLTKPNEWQVMSQFLYQLATILECQNTAFIFPELDRFGQDIKALHAINPAQAKVVQDKRGTYWLQAMFPAGGQGYVELSRVGILTKHQYRNLFFGERDFPLKPTLDLIKAQEAGIVEGVKSSASIRFLAKLAQVLKQSDIDAERQRFVTSNLALKNNGGVMMFDAKYSDVKQIDSKPFVVDDKQMALINENVYTFFGANKNIVMNSFDEDEWNAYYEGKIEPFAVQLSQVLANMFYSEKELAYKNYIIASANRLQYASNTTKLNIVTQLLDRGMLTPNEGREIFNMPGVGERGDKFYIRLEYGEIGENNGTDNGQDNGEDQQGA